MSITDTTEKRFEEDITAFWYSSEGDMRGVGMCTTENWGCSRTR